MSAHHSSRARTMRDDELVSAYIRLWGDVADYGKKHRDARVIVRFLDNIRSKSFEIKEARERDSGSIRVDELRREEDWLKNQLRRMSSTEDEHAKHLCEVAEEAREAILRQYHAYLEEDEDAEADKLGARLDDADEVVDGLKEGMEGNLPPEKPAQASRASSPSPKKRKREADRRPRNTAYKARVAGERGSLLRHAQSAASLSSASGAENALAKARSRLGYRQALRYFGVAY